MIRNLVIFVVTIFFYCKGFSQSAIQHFLDSLKNTPIFHIEKTIGFDKKAKKIHQKIDTTEVSLQQVHQIFEYYKYNSYKKEEYPFPLLIWAKTTAEKLDSQEDVIQALLLLGDVKRMTIYRDEALKEYQKALDIVKKLKNAENISYVKSRISLSYMTLNRYDESIAVNLELLETYKKLDKNDKIVITYHNIGDIFLSANDTINALKYLKLSDSLEQKYPDKPVRNMNTSFLGQIYLHFGDLEEAKKYLKKANKLINENGEAPCMLAYNLRDLGIIYEKQNNLVLAKLYTKKALAKIYNSSSTFAETLSLSSRLADILIRENNTKEAVLLLEDVYYNRVLKPKYSRYYVRSEFVEFYKKLSEGYEKIGNYKKAYFFKQKQVQAVLKNKNTDVSKHMNELEKKYQSKIDKQQIRLLKDKRDIERRNFIIALLALIVAIITSLFIYIHNRQRAKNSLKKEQLAQLALKNQKITTEKLKVEKRITDLELQLKQRELTAKSINLLQTKEKYSTLSNQLKELKPLVNDSNPEAVKKLNTVINSAVSSEVTYNWDEFKVTFEKVHTNFYNNLLKKHPNLSSNEKKICAFLKLGLNTKDISAITQQANRTIVVARSRLRKKLNLTKETNLTNYIATNF